MDTKVWLIAALASLLVAEVTAQTVLDSPELYSGEKALYEAAKKEGMVVSFDTGPTGQLERAVRGFRSATLKWRSSTISARCDGCRAGKANRPQADTAYYFAGSAFDAVAKNVVAPFKPVNFDKLTPVFRDPDGKWFTIHTLTVAFVVNTKLVKNVPQSWADLLKPEYKNTIVYLDPRSTGVGQVVVFAANFGNGGDMNNLQPGFDYFTKLQQSGNVLRVLGTTPYAQFVKGEIPIWISYENDGLKSKYTDGLGDAVAVVIPKEASAAAPYAISLVEKGPNPDAGKLWLNFIMTDMGQGIFAQGFVRPSVPGIKLPDNVADKLPAAPQVRPLDVKTAAAKKADVDKGWAAATGSK
jgi:putative spermidine/putrescine transport system substrate-binding protein